jgi:hypothetical protein
MKVDSGNSIFHPCVESEKNSAKLTGSELDAVKNIQNDSDPAQAQSVAKDAKVALHANGNLCRSLIDQDLDQAKNCIKQQILEYPTGSR